MTGTPNSRTLEVPMTEKRRIITSVVIVELKLRKVVSRTDLSTSGRRIFVCESAALLSLSFCAILLFSRTRSKMTIVLLME